MLLADVCIMQHTAMLNDLQMSYMNRLCSQVFVLSSHLTLETILHYCNHHITERHARWATFSYFMFRRSRVHFSARRPVLTKAFNDFEQSLQADDVIVPQIRSLSLPSTSLPIHYSLITLPFYSI
jgi:hypothetical protein